MITINLDDVANHGEVRNLAGKPRGEDARKAFNLDAVDASGEPVIVQVPDYIYAISSSFFLGLFSKSILKLGSAEAFLDRFRFSADEGIMRQVSHSLDRCLAPRGLTSAVRH